MWEIFKSLLWIIIAFLAPFWLPAVYRVISIEYQLEANDLGMVIGFLIVPIVVIGFVVKKENQARKQELLESLRQILREAKIIE